MTATLLDKLWAEHEILRRDDGVSLRQFTEKDGLDTKNVVAIYTDAKGDLWLGGKGVFRFNGTRFERPF